MAPETPKKLSAKDLANLFGVSVQRVSQLKRKGILRPDASNMYDVQEAMQSRHLRSVDHVNRMVTQTYSNGTGLVSPAKLDLTTQPVELSPEDREALGIPEAAPDIDENTSSVKRRLVSAIQMDELKAKKLRAEVERVETRAKKERGELVEKTKAFESSVSAGQLIANILQNLPAEIASIFADPDKKAEVRLKVQTRVDQCQHAIYSSLRDYGVPDAE